MFLLVCHGSTSTSVYHIIGLRLFKSYQFTVRIKCVWRNVRLLLNHRTTYQTFHWFYTSLSDPYHCDRNEHYSTLEDPNSFSTSGGILRNPSSVSSRQTQLQHPSTTSSLLRSNFLFKHPMFMSKISRFPFLIWQLRHI